MAVEKGKDYAYAKKISWVFKTGVGKALAVVTRELVIIFPYDTIAGAGNEVTTTKFSIGERLPTEAVEELLSDPSTTVDILDDTLAKWAKEVKGPILKSLHNYKRIKIRTKFLNRCVGFSEKEKGFDSGFGTAIVFRPTKEEMEDFINFFKDDSRVV